MLDGVLHELVVAALKVQEVHPLRAQGVAPVAAADPPALREAERAAHQRALPTHALLWAGGSLGRAAAREDQQHSVREALGHQPEELGAEVEVDLRPRLLSVAVPDLGRGVAASEDLGHELGRHGPGVAGAVHDFDLQVLHGRQPLPLPLDGARLLRLEGGKEVVEVPVGLGAAVEPPCLSGGPLHEAGRVEELAVLGRAEGHVHAQLCPLRQQDKGAEERLLHRCPLGRPKPAGRDEAAASVRREGHAYEELGEVRNAKVVGRRDPVHLLAELPAAVLLQVEGHGAHEPPAASC
mmetsp:Transcript_48493/g.149809  ORF Transcript_48493/g.149809 Transcript_48493/m.149809 type:complete len:295 (-) Transcript_48493:507-1391(-)